MELTFEQQSKLDHPEYWEKYTKWWTTTTVDKEQE